MVRTMRIRTWPVSSACALSLCVAASGFAQDSDSDGVDDNADLYPCDSSLAGHYAYPATDVHGTLLFEDQWPEFGDGDFNDAVITHNFLLRTNAANQVVSIKATFNVLAIGGLLDNGFGLHLPIAAAAVQSITRTVGAGSPQSLNLLPDGEMSVIVSNNLREFFGGQAGIINANPTPAQTAPAIQVDILLSTPVDASLITGLAPFDPYLFRSGDHPHQIHRSGFGGTSDMNSALFRTASDRSDPVSGVFFKDSRGLTFVIAIPTANHWPQEGVDIAGLFPNIISFATSGGTQDADFYSRGVDPTRSYGGTAGLVPGFVSTIPSPDLSCIPPPLVCRAFSNPDTRSCSGTALGNIVTDDYDGCRDFCAQNGAGCCAFSDYGRHPNYSRPGSCTAYSGPVQSGCNGCTIRITYASACVVPGVTSCGTFTNPDSQHCSGTAIDGIDTNDYDACRTFCGDNGAACCGFSDYGRHPNYSRPGRCTAYDAPVQSGCNGCTIRITYATTCN